MDDFRKSSFCIHTDHCVEVAAGGDSVLVRDEDGTVLAVPAQAWREFVLRVT